MNLGRTTVGGSQFTLVADTKRVARFHAPETINVAKGCVYLDGAGGGSAAQVCRLVIYKDSDALLGFSDEVTVQPGQEPGWVDFPFSAYSGALQLSAGDFFIGLIGGQDDSVIRMYGDDPRGAGGKRNSDTYVDGPSDPFGAATALTADLSAYLAVFPAYATLRPVEQDIYFTRLPFVDAQAVLGSTGPDASRGQRLVSVGWHDTFLDPESGSVAMVRDGSTIEDMLGERIKVTLPGAQPISVFAYVHNLADPDLVDWDLSLSRHLFGHLAMLASYTIEAVVEVLS